MKRICAWHPQNFGVTLTMEDGTEPATHGICADCKAIEWTKIEANLREANAQFSEPVNPGSVPLDLDHVARDHHPDFQRAEMQQRRDLATGRDYGIGYDARRATPRDQWTPAMVQAHEAWMKANERDLIR